MVTFTLAEPSYRESKTKIFNPETQRVSMFENGVIMG
jgi:hypothetical protein